MWLKKRRWISIWQNSIWDERKKNLKSEFEISLNKKKNKLGEKKKKKKKHLEVLTKPKETVF